MFSVLLGYGLVLSFESQISKGKKEKDATKTIRRRSWYLILFGIMLAVFIVGQDPSLKNEIMLPNRTSVI